MWIDASNENWRLLAVDSRAIINNGTMVLRIQSGVNQDAVAFSETDFDNTGQIFVINEGSGSAIAVDSYVAGSPVNSGLIAVRASNGPAYGFLYNNPGSLNNQLGGQILVEGVGAIAYYQASGPAYSLPLINAGTIQAHSLDPEVLSFGFYLSGSGSNSEIYQITNSGIISADVAIYGADDYATTVGQVIQEVNNLSGGTITGLIYLQRGSDILVNAGTINGNVVMGEGSDRVDNRGGTINGLIDLGWDNDTFEGGDKAEFVSGSSGGDSLAGNGGNDQLMGGSGNDTLVGGAGNDGLFGEWGNDRIVTSGSDYVIGGAGDDRVELGDYNFEFVSGSDGFDTLVLASGARTLNLGSIVTTGRLFEFEQIDLAGDKTLSISPLDVVGLTGGETSLQLLTSSSDQINLVGSWATGPDQLINGVAWRVFVSGSSTVLVRGSGQVNLGVSIVEGTLDAIVGDRLAPIPEDGILGLTAAVTEISNYELNVPIVIEAHEIFRTPDGGTMFTCWEWEATLTNYGRIESIGSGGTALSTNNISQITNYGTILAQATVVGYGAVSIDTDNSAELRNFGLIRAEASGGGARGVAVSSGTNAGTIEAIARGGSALALSVLNGTSRPFVNTGQVAANSGDPANPTNATTSVGAIFTNVTEIHNSGSITAHAENGSAYAVQIFGDVWNTQMTNSGLIAATVANSVNNTVVGVAISAEYADYFVRFENTALGMIRGDVHLAGLGAVYLTNAGTIDGSIRQAAYQAGIPQYISVENRGTITGGFQLASSQGATILNYGTITGNIQLGAGNDHLNSATGAHTGIISGGEGNDYIVGGTGAETINGDAGKDTIGGGLGTDVLTGGAGVDIFRDSSAGWNGDTITDLSAGEVIVFTDANLASFTYSLSGSTLTYSGGTITLAGFSGRLVVSAALGGGVQLSAPHHTTNDFNGDGRSDILWRHVDGTISNWLARANGSFVDNDRQARSIVSTDWQVAGTGDFNGDGRSDVLWRGPNGELSNWLGSHLTFFGEYNGGFINNDANAFTVVGRDWTVVGTGDFNGDGRDDILWRSSTGQLSNWLGQTNGAFNSNDANAFTTVATSWSVVGVGDFNGDGRDDILWRSDTGQLSNWLGTANGGFAANDANAFSNVPTNWQVAGVGDFNGDGRDDILWRSTTGQMSNWLGTANGGFAANDANAFANVPTNWHIVAVGDYNGDGRDDILWRSDTGQLSNWLGTANGGFAGNDGNALTHVPTVWHVQPEHPMV